MRTRLFVSLALLIAVAAGAADRKNDSYIYKRGGHSSVRMSGGLDQLGSIDRLSKRYGSEFVWISRGGKQYVIRDASTLASIRTAFRDVDALHPELEAAEERMHPHTDRMEALGRQMEALGHSSDDARREKIERAMEKVEREMKDVQRQLERVSARMERLNDVAEKQFEKIVDRAIASGVAERVR